MGIVSKIDDYGVALKKCSSKHFGCVQKELQKKQKLLAQVELVALNTGINFQARMLRREVNDQLDKEMKMWFQRSRSLWAVHGDRNSKFFHMKATQRYRRNRISKIKNSLGQWCTDQRVIATEVTDFFSKLYSSSNSCQPKLALGTIKTIVTDDMNRKLATEFKECEVHEAVSQMAPLKAPGLDGMPPLFFQHFWGLVGKEITSSVLFFLNSATLLEHINHTFLTLIPNVKNLELVSEFRPISLCNVVCKLFSKVLANRLKRILPKIITEHQSAFTKDRLISNNILIAFESLHCMQNHKPEKDGCMALKPDMSKAYD